jgi:NADH-quinone oxidoreductase subunit E
VDDDYYEDMDYDSTVRLLEALKRGERPKPGSMTGRQGSAPIGGPETVLDIPMAEAAPLQAGPAPLNPVKE